MRCCTLVFISLVFFLQCGPEVLLFIQPDLMIIATCVKTQASVVLMTAELKLQPQLSTSQCLSLC